MKRFRVILFVLIGIAGLTAGTCIILRTIALFLLTLITKNAIGAIGYGILWFIEMAVINYLVNDYHGE